MVSGLEHKEIFGNPDVEIENLEYDSRLIKPNGLFIAVEGYQVNGFDFVDSAVANGAVAVIGERKTCDNAPNYVQVKNIRKAMPEIAGMFYGHPGLKIKACGVTGTNGKTTTCFLIKNILEARNKKVGLITSQIYDTGDEKFEAERTTPESLDLQRLLFLMKKNFCVNAVIEVSSHALSLHRVDNINFRVAVYTNLTRDHLDFHKTMEEYLAAKTLLLKKLEGPLSYAVINLDVPEFRGLFGDFASSFISYSLEDSEADIYCSNYDIQPQGTIFDIVTPMGNRTIDYKLAGKFNLINAIAAIGGGMACGVDIDSVVKGLESAQPIPGRFNYVDLGQPFAVYIDYAHTPDALERLIMSAREISDGRIFTLFGCGGDRDKGKRSIMGQAATINSDYAIVTSDNPRSEDAAAIIEDIKPGLVGNNYEICIDREEAIKKIVGLAKEGDVVLLAGKGDENYQEIKGVKSPFSDKDVALKFLHELGYAKSEDKQEN